MKGLLKRVIGGVKYVAAFLPIALALGGEATFIWLASTGVNSYDRAIQEAKESPAMQEVIESDLGILKEQVDNKQITMQEYQEKKAYWDEEENIIKYIKQDEEANKYYLDEMKKGSDMATSGIVLSVAYPLISTVGIWAFFTFDGFAAIIDSARDDMEEAKEIKDEKRKKEEYDEYKEELQ